MKFYFNDCFPDTRENRAFARQTLQALRDAAPLSRWQPGSGWTTTRVTMVRGGEVRRARAAARYASA